MTRASGAVLFLACVVAACGPDAASPVPGSKAVLPNAAATVPAGEGDLYVDVTAAAGIRAVHHLADDKLDNIVETMGAGAVWFDFDGDRKLDLYLVNGAWSSRVNSSARPAMTPANSLWRNRGDGTFEDVTDGAAVGDRGFGLSACAADFDDDGHVDLYVMNVGPNVLYRNRGDGTFEDVTAAAGVAGDRCSVGGTFFDADGDGRLDLYVGNYLEYDPQYVTHYSPDVFPGPLAYSAEADRLYLNSGDGTFRDATVGSGIDVPVAGRAMGVSTLDYDRDGDTDVFVANDATDNFLFRNDGGGKFTEVALSMGIAFGVNGEATAAMAGALGDADDDGWPDLHVTDSRYGSLYVNRKGKRFQDVIFQSGIGAPSGQWASWGGGFLDFDLDGDQDLLLVNGDMHRATGRPDLLLENDGKGRFTDASDRGGAYFRTEVLGRAGAIADYDDDGDPDVLVTTIDGRPYLLQHQGVPGAHWVTFSLEGAPGRRHAFGTRVTVTAGGRTWTRLVGPATGYLSQSDPRILLGLGGAERIDKIVVEWQGGASQTFENVAVDRIHCLAEGGKLR